MKTQDISEASVECFSAYVDGISRPGELYIHRSMRVYHQTDSELEQLVRDTDYSDPFIFLTGVRQAPAYVFYQDQAIAEAPFIAMLVGPYGTGKTELVLQLSRFALKSDTMYPVCVSLPRCRAHKSLLDREIEIDDFLTIIGGGLPTELTRTSAQKRQLLQAIRHGKVLLILDALDELADTPRRHINFVLGLRKLLIGDRHHRALQFRVVITMRREYLSHVDRADARDTISALAPSDAAFNLFLLEINQFNESEIGEYCRRRIGMALNIDLVEVLAQFPTLLALLCRPLLLKIFIDLCAQKDIVKLVSVFTFGKVPGDFIQAGELFEAYIHCSHQTGMEQQEVLGASYMWNIDRLAEQSAALFANGESEFREQDIEAIREPLPGNEVRTAEQPFASVYKCPFLLLDSNRVRFSHRAFFEFFTAKGIAADVSKNGVENSRMFNELVVNPDMRKFLQYFLKDFYSKIELSCGLRSADGWNLRNFDYREALPELTTSLRILTEGMTQPEIDRRDVEERIDWFLDTCEISEFHPGYMIYCFEAIATYIHERPWSRASRASIEKLSELLEAAFNFGIARITDRGWQQLIERALAIGRLLHFNWALKKATAERHNWLDDEWDSQTRRRVIRIIEDFKHLLS